MNAVQRICTIALALVSVCSSGLAQPRISYLIPDLGSTRMATYLEVVAPVNLRGAYGANGMHLNNPGGSIRLICERAADTAKVKIGPIVVSWDGRLISTHIFVNPLVKPNSEDWSLLDPAFRIPLRVVVNGDTSNADTFYIVRPATIGDVSSSAERVLGQGALGKRSRRGAMLVDSIVFSSDALYTVSVNDCDNQAPGNQGLLPFVLIARGNLRGKGGAGQVNTEIHVDAVGPDAGSGGGGGGGGYANLNITGDRGSRGGNGYTGGGPGGFNNNGVGVPANEKQIPGIGSGESLSKNNNNTRGSASLNGQPGGESTTAFENAGGGTGHPFGQSGDGCDNRTSCVTIGRSGGGSGAREGRRGGGGGFGVAGGSEAGFDHGGKVHGNECLIPLAGGSGGASGNPDLANRSSSGGGGGGAISIHAELAANFSVYAKGGLPSRDAILAGCGSGGGIIVGTRIDNAKFGFVGGQVSGGSDPNPSPTNRHLDGGRGRPRYDARVPVDVSYYVGVVTDTMTNSLRQDFYTGFGNGQDLQVFIKPENGDWQLGTLISGYSGSWRRQLTWPGRDTLYYVLVGQRIPNPSTGAFASEPQWVFSQSAWNVIRIYGPPIISAPKRKDQFVYRCMGETLRDTVWVRNRGESPLVISSATFPAGTGFRLAAPTVFPDSINPFDSVAYVIEYQPLPGQTGLTTVSANLTIDHNDTTAGANPHVVYCEVNWRLIDLVFAWRGIPGDTIDVGRICIGTPFTDQITVRNNGTSTATVTSYLSTDPAVLTVTANVPFQVAPTLSRQVEVTFLARRLGVSVIPTLLYLAECTQPDTIWVRHEGVSSSVTLFGTTQFGTVRVGDSPQLVVELRNTGTSDLDIPILPAIPAPFRVVSTTPPIPALIPPGASLFITLAYEPLSAGTHVSAVSVRIVGTARSCPDSINLVLAAVAKTSSIGVSSGALDYGTVSACDSVVDSVVVRNTGGVPFTILYPPFLNGPNASQFRIAVQPQNDLVLNPGSSATYVVVMYGTLGPSGVKSAILSIRTSDATVGNLDIPLTGIRVSSSLNGPRIVDLGQVVVGTTGSAQRTYTNGGGSDISVVGSISSFPVRTSSTPVAFTVASGGTQSITFSTICTIDGAIEDTVRLILDAPCPDTIIILVRAIGVTPRISAPSIVDFGLVPECRFSRDSLVYANTSDAPIDFIDLVISGPDAAIFSIENPGAVAGQTLQPGEQRTIYVRFDPRATTDGVKTALLTLRVRLAGVPVSATTILRGERRTMLPATPGSVVFGDITLAITSTQRVSLVNNGVVPIRVSSIAMRGTSGNEFAVRSVPAAPFTLAPGASVELIIDFTPSTQQVFRDSVFIVFDQPCADTRIIAVTGTGRLNVEIEVSLPDIVASPSAEDYAIPISATILSGSPEILNARFTATVRYKTSMFAARTLTTGAITRNVSVGGFTELDIEIPTFTAVVAKSTIGEIVGDMTLGTEVKTDLTFLSPVITAQSITPFVRPINGSLSLEICEEGGPRLIKLAGSLAIRVAPNPASGHVTLIAEVYERGSYQLSIVSVTGIVVFHDAWERNATQDQQEIIFNASLIASGTYQVVLQTPSRRMITQLSILH